MDVLRYSATNACSYLQTQCTQKAACIPTRVTCLSNLNSCLGTKCSELAQVQSTANSVDPEATCWVQCIEPCLLRLPQTTSLWACIPQGTSWTGGLKVCRCAGNSQFNYGSCCLWTVPGGATCVRFQIWGAGGGSGSQQCCGGSPFGSTGAYASVLLPVSAGWQYTLCAGCALACYPSRRAEGRYPGCPSFVQGCRLVNFCAQGGQGRMGNWMAAYGKRNTYRLSSAACNYAGSCFCCFGSQYCFINSCATCGEIPHVPGASYFGATTTNAIVYGIRGMWPIICYDTNHYGYQIHPPIYGFEGSTCCCQTWTTGTCCGKVFSACCGRLQVPGAGGWATIAMGGSYGTCGDMGKSGMVCVSWK